MDGGGTGLYEWRVAEGRSSKAPCKIPLDHNEDLS